MENIISILGLSLPNFFQKCVVETNKNAFSTMTVFPQLM